MKQYLIFPLCIFLFIFNSCSKTPQDDKALLNQACQIYTDNWQALDYHYSSKKEFHDLCLKKTNSSTSILDGLWNIRSLLPDGHADFRIEPQTPTKIMPFLLGYSDEQKAVTVAAVFDPALQKIKGKQIVSINDTPVSDLIHKRAQLEPQSTESSSLFLAARTLTYSPSWHPYPDFSDTMALTFSDKTKMQITSLTLKQLTTSHPDVLGSNNYPSFWGELDSHDTDRICDNEDDRLELIQNADGQSWLWWHLKGLNFDVSENSLPCWNKMAKQPHTGVVLDLRDTAGGSYEPVLLVLNILTDQKELAFKRIISAGDISQRQVDTQRLEPTKRGFLQNVVVKNTFTSTTQWFGRLIVMTNPICGSGCDLLAHEISQREGTCTYGRPTAGRVVGTSTIDLNKDVSLTVPMREILKPDGSRWEGYPTIPQFPGSGTVSDAIDVCNHAYALTPKNYVP